MYQVSILPTIVYMIGFYLVRFREYDHHHKFYSFFWHAFLSLMSFILFVIHFLIQICHSFLHIYQKSTAEDLIERELPLKFVEVDEEQSRLVLSNRKAMADSQAQLGIGSVVIGTVQSLKPYGAFIDIGGINGLLHVSQISHDRVSDIATVLQPGDTLKVCPQYKSLAGNLCYLVEVNILKLILMVQVMILSHDRERGRVSLSTKKLEPTPGDMIRNPKLVFEKVFSDTYPKPHYQLHV